MISFDFFSIFIFFFYIMRRIDFHTFSHSGVIDVWIFKGLVVLVLWIVCYITNSSFKFDCWVVVVLDYSFKSWDDHFWLLHSWLLEGF